MKKLTLIALTFLGSKKPEGGSIVPPPNIFVNTCDGTMQFGTHVYTVIIYNAMSLHVHFSHHFFASACGGLRMRVLFTQ